MAVHATLVCTELGAWAEGFRLHWSALLASLSVLWPCVPSLCVVCPFYTLCPARCGCALCPVPCALCPVPGALQSIAPVRLDGPAADGAPQQLPEGLFRVTPAAAGYTLLALERGG